MRAIPTTLAIVLISSSLTWAQPAGEGMTITTPDGKTISIRRDGPADEVEQTLTKFLRGSQNGKLIMRAGPMRMELDKQGNQVSLITPEGRKTSSTEEFLKSFVGSFRAARNAGQAKACESNMKNIATALEMYAMDHKNNYPDSLKQLPPGNYLRFIPTCPAASRDTYSATYRKSGQSFEFHCSGNHAGRTPGHPIYNSNEGLTP